MLANICSRLRAARREAVASATLCLAATVALGAAPVAAQYEWTASRPDGHAPIGVMGDHTHGGGEWMLSYRFMRMSMAGNRAGTERIETADVLRDFMVAPLDMTTTMHMAGIMYAPSDVVTLMAMGSWLDRSMNHETRPGGMFEAVSSGPGDAAVAALIGLKRAGSVRAHLNAGVSIPVGSINEAGENPMSMGREVQMPYPMQLGSGTWDIRPGITILGMSERTSWGLQGTGVFRLHRNSREYKQGSVIEGTGWFAVRAADRLSLSARLLLRRRGNHTGTDPVYGNRTMAPAPTVREDLRGGTRLDVPLGLNIHFRRGALKGHRIAAEWHIPVYQSLNGPQLETDRVLSVGWQKSFEPIGHD